MTKEQAIDELTRCAEICPTTPLAEACRMAVDALGESWERVGRELGPDCVNCRYSDRMPSVYPCSECVTGFAAPSNWKPKEVDNGKTD
jgi:hypothetical protein